MTSLTPSGGTGELKPLEAQEPLSSNPCSHEQVYYQDTTRYLFIVFNSGLFTLWSNGLSNHIYTDSATFVLRGALLPLPDFTSGLLPKFQVTENSPT